jgi:regulator of sigma E protease
MAAGQDIRTLEDLQEATAPQAGQPTEYVVERDGHRLDPMTITPDEVDGRGIIGVRPEVITTYVPQSVGESARRAVVYPFELTMLQLTGIAHLAEKGTTEGLVGPVGMGKEVARQAGRGVGEYVLILVVLSVALGLFNLLPFPALDGGRLAFLGFELITRRRPNEKFEAAVHTVGILFLLGVLVLVTFRDVTG